jgi:hypothetical protein
MLGSPKTRRVPRFLAPDSQDLDTHCEGIVANPNIEFGLLN